MRILPTHELKKLPTHRLLALYRKNFKHMQNGYASITDYGTMPEVLQDLNDPLVKEIIELNGYCDEMKFILNSRENIKRRKNGPKQGE
jgi:hypothetical protein